MKTHTLKNLGRTAGSTTSLLLLAITLNLSAGNVLTDDSQSTAKWKRVAFIGEAEVKTVEGKVELSIDGNNWVAAQPRASLGAGAMLRTHEDGKATLSMKASGSMVRISPQTIMRLASLPPKADRSILTGREERPGLRIRAVRGSASWRENQKSWKPLITGSVLARGASIKTGPETTVDVFDPDTGLVVRMNENTHVEFRGSPVVLSGSILSNAPFRAGPVFVSARLESPEIR